MSKTPFTIVGCGYVGDADGRRWSTIDTTIALENMVVAAWALGVGSCWVGDFREEEVKRLLNIPDDWSVISLITFGYPAEQPMGRWKKPLDEIMNHNRFQDVGGANPRCLFNLCHGAGYSGFG